MWEYYLRGCYLDAVWFPDTAGSGEEYAGTNAASKYPISGRDVILCEAKIRLTPELIGQAVVYNSFAHREGARVRFVAIFAETGSDHLRIAADDLGLKVVLDNRTME